MAVNADAKKLRRVTLIITTYPYAALQPEFSGLPVDIVRRPAQVTRQLFWESERDVGSVNWNLRFWR